MYLSFQFQSKQEKMIMGIPGITLGQPAANVPAVNAATQNNNNGQEVRVPPQSTADGFVDTYVNGHEGKWGIAIAFVTSGLLVSHLAASSERQIQAARRIAGTVEDATSVAGRAVKVVDAASDAAETAGKVLK